MNDIAERLGYHREHPITGKLVLTNPDGPEAAAEIVRLRAERDEARYETHVLRISNATLSKDIRAAEAERDRLRDALDKPTPEMIAAAWGAWKERHKDRIGPGPGFVEAITAALAALKGDTPSTAAGYVLAPVEPTPEMLAAWWRQKNAGTQEIGKTGPDTSDHAAYRAMLAAAQEDGK